MIYSDQYAHLDTEEKPFDRSEHCLNCGERHGMHYGWSCSECLYEYEGCFSTVHPTNRYETKSMRNTSKSQLQFFDVVAVVGDSIEIARKPIKDLTDWRAWAHNVEGECPCGIHRQQCDYHKDTVK